MLTTQAQVAVAMAKLGSEADKTVLDHEFQRFTDQIDRLHDRMLAEDDRTHATQLAAVGQVHDAVTGHLDRAHAAGVAGATAATDVQQQHLEQQHQAALAAAQAAQSTPPGGGAPGTTGP